MQSHLFNSKYSHNMVQGEITVRGT